MGNINANYKAMEYAVRGPIVIRAGEIEKELLKVSALHPFQFAGKLLSECTLRAYTHAIYRARRCTVAVIVVVFFLSVLWCYFLSLRFALINCLHLAQLLSLHLSAGFANVSGKKCVWNLYKTMWKM